MVGIDPTSDFTVGPWLREHLGGRLGENELIVGANAHIFLGRSSSTVGDSEFFFGRQLRVAGVLEPTGLGLDEAGFVSLETAYAMARESEQKAYRKLEIAPGQISALMVNLKPDASRAAVAKRIELEVPGVAVVTSRELFSSSVARQLESLTPGLLLIGVGFWLIAALMIGAMFSMLVNERRRELGLLQAMAATSGFIFRLVMMEAVQLTALGGLIGLALGAGVIGLTQGWVADSLSVSFLWPGRLFITTFVAGFLLLAVATGALAALYPALVASRLEPYQAIRSGE